MRRRDAPDTHPPSEGMRRMMAWRRTQGDQVTHPRVQRRRRRMGREASEHKPRLNLCVGTLPVSPDRLRGGHGERVQQVWRADSPDIRLRQGCVAAVAVRDWGARAGLAWDGSATRDRDGGIRALERALVPAQPEIVTAEQGAPVTSTAVTERLRARGMPVRLDGRGRPSSARVCGDRSRTRPSIATRTGACQRPSAVGVGLAASITARAGSRRSTITRQRPSIGHWPGEGRAGCHLTPADVWS
jgi:hypothetical protein